MNPDTNDALVGDLYRSIRIVNIFRENVSELWTHAMLAPAIIQLRRMYSITEGQIERLFDQLARYRELANGHAPMFFLVEHVPVPPRLVYLVLSLVAHMGGQFNMFFSHQALQTSFERLVQQRVDDYPQLAHLQYQRDPTEADWRELCQPIMDECTYDADQFTYMRQLLTLRGPSLGDRPVTESLALYAVLLVNALDKCHVFQPFVGALGVRLSDADLAMGTPPTDDYDNFSYTTTVQDAIAHLARARRIVFGPNLSPFERLLADKCFSIAASCSYDPDLVVQFLAIMNTTVLTMNVHKKLHLLQGATGSGKSLALNEVHHIMRPKVGRFNTLDQVQDRSGLNEYVLLALNELQSFRAARLKCITGNDNTSVQQFYTQNYVMHTTHPLVFGATNVHISFQSRGADIDRPTIERLNVVLMNGQHVPPTVPQSHFFRMLTNNCHFVGTIEQTVEEGACALQWLAYAYYRETRDDGQLPTLPTTRTSDKYQEMTYRLNSPTYMVIVLSDMVWAPGFFISTTTFLRKVYKTLERQAGDQGAAGSSGGPGPNVVLTPSGFRARFDAMYGSDLQKATLVRDFQLAGLVSHIRINMATVVDPSGCITPADIEARLAVYEDQEHRENARDYFGTQNTLHKSGVFLNVSFVNATLHRYKPPASYQRAGGGIGEPWSASDHDDGSNMSAASTGSNAAAATRRTRVNTYDDDGDSGLCDSGNTSPAATAVSAAPPYIDPARLAANRTRISS